MANEWIDQEKIREQLAQFFKYNYSELDTFGRTVNQTFEAFVFASVIRWYNKKGWKIHFQHPKNNMGKVHLKYTTMGRPDKYTYAIAIKGKEKIEIRHNIRIRSAHSNSEYPVASFVIDVGVLKAGYASNLSTYDPVDNENLITFAEAKHMTAFAELISSFIGAVHELMPKKLKKYKPLKNTPLHPSPFLFVSGFTNPSAAGVIKTITERGFRISICDRDSKDLHGLSLQKIPTKPAGRK